MVMRTRMLRYMHITCLVITCSNEGVLLSPLPDLPPDVEGRNRLCRWKERFVHVPNYKSFLVTEAERKHVRRRARFQQQ
jgi:hypothetical protein